VSGVRIGLDFDNTIICYDGVFVAAARRRGLIPQRWSGRKIDVRDHLRAQRGGELEWQGLQGWVYGKGIGYAEIFEGVNDFLDACRKANARVYIVSHKTEFGHQDPDRTDLRAAARSWMRAAGLAGTEHAALAIDDIYFEDTLKAKVARLASLDLDVFIDDLIDVFEQPQFPQQTRCILFGDPEISRTSSHINRCKSLATWADIQREIFAP
jgi:hypothetical protein